MSRLFRHVTGYFVFRLRVAGRSLPSDPVTSEGALSIAAEARIFSSRLAVFSSRLLALSS